ncbi:MAG: Hsp20/alpha crystallin family protein [Patescibacteria group bacterium]
MNWEDIDNQDTNTLDSDKWLSDIEGQLSVDVSETNDSIIIRSVVAGVKPEDIDISVTTDTITIRGERNQCDSQKNEVAHIQECFWGKFSRSIVLPQTVNTQSVDAKFKDGILTITLTKSDSLSRIPITEVD